MTAVEPQAAVALTKILRDCARLEDDRPTGVARLRHALGEELAHLLLSALAGDHRRARLVAV